MSIYERLSSVIGYIGSSSMIYSIQAPALVNIPHRLTPHSSVPYNSSNDLNPTARHVFRRSGVSLRHRSMTLFGDPYGSPPRYSKRAKLLSDHDQFAFMCSSFEYPYVLRTLLLNSRDTQLPLCVTNIPYHVYRNHPRSRC